MLIKINFTKEEKDTKYEKIEHYREEESSAIGNWREKIEEFFFSDNEEKRKIASYFYIECSQIKRNTINWLNAATIFLLFF